VKTTLRDVEVVEDQLWICGDNGTLIHVREYSSYELTAEAQGIREALGSLIAGSRIIEELSPAGDKSLFAARHGQVQICDIQLSLEEASGVSHNS
jgi:hypothetical protein